MIISVEYFQGSWPVCGVHVGGPPEIHGDDPGRVPLGSAVRWGSRQGNSRLQISKLLLKLLKFFGCGFYILLMK